MPIEGGGIDVGHADELLKDVLWTPQLLTEQNSANTTETTAAEPSPREVDAEFDKLSTQVVSPVDGDGLAASVPVSEVYNLTTFGQEGLVLAMLMMNSSSFLEHQILILGILPLYFSL